MVGPGELVGGSWGTRQQDQRTQLRNDWREKTLQYNDYTVSNLYSKKAVVITNAMYSGFILYTLSQIESA